MCGHGPALKPFPRPPPTFLHSFQEGVKCLFFDDFYLFLHFSLLFALLHCICIKFYIYIYYNSILNKHKVAKFPPGVILAHCTILY
ncbi:hypothetical protein GDO81_023024 [Engystomops pustulosus]|uniref:Uncharacterized protein n=1 Tax=Engystomops pustulosus TaxID=76066 RepID=A0AAV6YR94_ENGPU|nr:hypothetical protein GDO81_023024 [Engystomops pustulosus]